MKLLVVKIYLDRFFSVFNSNIQDNDLKVPITSNLNKKADYDSKTNDSEIENKIPDVSDFVQKLVREVFLIKVCV